MRKGRKGKRPGAPVKENMLQRAFTGGDKQQELASSNMLVVTSVVKTAGTHMVKMNDYSVTADATNETICAVPTAIVICGVQALGRQWV